MNDFSNVASFYEIERKFLVVNDSYKKKAFKKIRIAQGYIIDTPEKTIRIRIVDNKAWLTIKGPSFDGGMSRFEWEKSISYMDACALMVMCEGNIIVKDRYLVVVGIHIFEVDDFLETNDGLVMAEIELGRATECFELPSWAGTEVTGNEKYYNAYLALHPYQTWQEDEKVI